MQELYYWFENGKAPEESGENSRMIDKIYKALKWAPSPLLSVKDGKDDQQMNPAPLWMYDESLSPKFSIRANLDDHSDHRRNSCKPGMDGISGVPQQTGAVVNASFRHNQIPGARSLYSTTCGEFRTGSFIQVSFRRVYHDKELDLVARFWAPVIMESLTAEGILSKDERVLTLVKTFTSGFEDMEFEPRDRLLKCMSYHIWREGSADTNLIRFDLEQNTGNVFVWTYLFEDGSFISEKDQTSDHRTEAGGHLPELTGAVDRNLRKLEMNDVHHNDPRPFRGNGHPHDDSNLWWIMSKPGLVQSNTVNYMRFFLAPLGATTDPRNPVMIVVSPNKHDGEKTWDIATTFMEERGIFSQQRRLNYKVAAPTMSNDESHTQIIQMWGQSILYARADTQWGMQTHIFRINDKYEVFLGDAIGQSWKAIPGADNSNSPCLLVVPPGGTRSQPMLVIMYSGLATYKPVIGGQAYVESDGAFNIAAYDMIFPTSPCILEKWYFQGVMPGKAPGSSTEDGFQIL